LHPVGLIIREWLENRRRGNVDLERRRGRLWGGRLQRRRNAKRIRDRRLDGPRWERRRRGRRGAWDGRFRRFGPEQILVVLVPLAEDALVRLRRLGGGGGGDRHGPRLRRGGGGEPGGPARSWGRGT